MNNHDPADLDGDGEFDAIDIVILEEGQETASQIGIQGAVGWLWSPALHLQGQLSPSANSCHNEDVKCVAVSLFSVMVLSVTSPSICRSLPL